MTIGIIILLLLVAIGLILVEIFLIPGVGIPGIIGVALLGITLFLAYDISVTVGHYTLVGSSLASVGLLLLALRSKTWSRVSVHDEISGKIDYHTEALVIGETGIAVTRLNPIGNVRFGDKIFEARTRGEYIDEESTVEITNIEGNKITVVTANQ